MFKMNVLQIGFEENKNDNEKLDGYIGIEKGFQEYVTDEMINNLKIAVNEFLTKLFEKIKEN